jgi:putative ABC transport system ATP-binding protein
VNKGLTEEGLMNEGLMIGGEKKEVVIRAVAVKRSFGRTPVLRGIDLSVEQGEWVALMGPSGSGKSTLLHLLGGLDTVDKGTIHIAGHALHNSSVAERTRVRRDRCGFVFQFANLLMHLDVRTNVELAGRIGGLNRRTARGRADQLLRRLGLGERMRSAPATLSGGEQQRVAIARALINDPDVLFADEPTGALDTAATNDVLDLLGEFHSEGQTIVLVTHDHRVAARGDRIVRLRDGRVIDEIDPHGRMQQVGPDVAPPRSRALLRLATFEETVDDETEGWT